MWSIRVCCWPWKSEKRALGYPTQRSAMGSRIWHGGRNLGKTNSRSTRSAGRFPVRNRRNDHIRVAFCSHYFSCFPLQLDVYLIQLSKLPVYAIWSLVCSYSTLEFSLSPILQGWTLKSNLEHLRICSPVLTWVLSLDFRLWLSPSSIWPGKFSFPILTSNLRLIWGPTWNP